MATKIKAWNKKRVNCDLCGADMLAANLKLHKDALHYGIRRYMCMFTKDDGSFCGYPGAVRPDVIRHIAAIHYKIPAREDYRVQVSAETAKEIESLCIKKESRVSVSENGVGSSGSGFTKFFNRKKTIADHHPIFSTLINGKLDFSEAARLDARFTEICATLPADKDRDGNEIIDPMQSENYLLLDQRKVQGLIKLFREEAVRGDFSPDMLESFAFFLLALFYFGKGVPGRFYTHERFKNDGDVSKS